MIKCPACGAPNYPGNSGCHYCKTALAAPVGTLPYSAPGALVSRPPAVATPSVSGGCLAAVLLALGVLVLGAVLGGGLFLATRGSSPPPAQPETLVDQTISLHEGQTMGYAFSLSTAANIDLVVSSRPRPVNVMLMTEAEWQRYNAVQGELFGGRYTYRQALSALAVVDASRTAVLPPGTWRVAVERPQESLLFGDDANVAVRIVARPLPWGVY